MNKTPIVLTSIMVFIVIFSMNASASVSIENKTIGYSCQKRPITATIIKDISCQDNKVYAFITYQHGSEWSGREIVNGMVNELIKNKESISCKEYHFILNANPDGIKLYSRYNAKGIDLNRVWASSDSGAWETKYTRKYLKTLDDYKQIDFFADVHGYNGAETQSEIIYETPDAGILCSKVILNSKEFICANRKSTSYTAKWNAVNILKIPIVFTIEPVQKMVKYTKQQYQEMGKKIINTI